MLLNKILKAQHFKKPSFGVLLQSFVCLSEYLLNTLFSPTMGIGLGFMDLCMLPLDSNAIFSLSNFLERIKTKAVNIFVTTWIRCDEDTDGFSSVR